MIKIFPTIQLKELDAYTIENEPVSSIDLMERASRALALAMTRKQWRRCAGCFTSAGGTGLSGRGVSFQYQRHVVARLRNE